LPQDRPLIVCDIDNTLLRSWGVYDKAYYLTSLELLGTGFIMTKNPDGTLDITFSKMTNGEILKNRLRQLGIDEKKVDEQAFFIAFDRNAEMAASLIPSCVFPGVETMLQELFSQARLVVLTSGTKLLQKVVLVKAGLDKYLDLDNSLFYGEYQSKRQALEFFAGRFIPASMVHFGDAPSDMRAALEASCEYDIMAVGTTIAGLVDEGELYMAGADLVLTHYDQAAKEILRLLGY
jgi:phosphoglycolate phosphatase-like HAD superfamily hydrolase